MRSTWPSNELLLNLTLVLNFFSSDPLDIFTFLTSDKLSELLSLFIQLTGVFSRKLGFIVPVLAPLLNGNFSA